MRITGPNVRGEPDDPERSMRVLRRAVELGITFIDTADSYGPEVSERLIAEALHPYPDGLVIATKGGLTADRGRASGRPTGGPSTCGGLRGEPAASEARPDRPLPAPPARPGRSARGVGRRPGGAAREGKVRHIGLSNVRSTSSSGARASSRSCRSRTGTQPGNRSCEDVLEHVKRGARVPPLVSARAGRWRARRAARPRRRGPRRNAGAGRPRVAPCALAGRCSRSRAHRRSSTWRRTSQQRDSRSRTRSWPCSPVPIVSGPSHSCSRSRWRSCFPDCRRGRYQRGGPGACARPRLRRSGGGAGDQRGGRGAAPGPDRGEGRRAALCRDPPGSGHP